MCLATQNSVAFQKPKTVQWIPFCKGICGMLMELKTLLQRFPWQPACAYVFTHALTIFQRCAFCLADTLLQRCTLLQRLHPFAKVAPFCKGGPHKLIRAFFQRCSAFTCAYCKAPPWGPLPLLCSIGPFPRLPWSCQWSYCICCSWPCWLLQWACFSHQLSGYHTGMLFQASLLLSYWYWAIFSLQ